MAPNKIYKSACSYIQEHMRREITDLHACTPPNPQTISAKHLAVTGHSSQLETVQDRTINKSTLTGTEACYDKLQG